MKVPASDLSIVEVKVFLFICLSVKIIFLFNLLLNHDEFFHFFHNVQVPEFLYMFKIQIRYANFSSFYYLKYLEVYAAFSGDLQLMSTYLFSKDEPMMLSEYEHLRVELQSMQLLIDKKI